MTTTESEVVSDYLPRSKRSHAITARQLLRLDAFGALLTASVAAYAAYDPTLFGMPAYHMGVLSVLAFGIAAYGGYFVVQRSADWSAQLLRVAKANLLYIGLTAALVLRFWKDLTTVGLAYFAIEGVIVLLLVRYERRVVARANVIG